MAINVLYEDKTVLANGNAALGMKWDGHIKRYTMYMRQEKNRSFLCDSTGFSLSYDGFMNIVRGFH